MTSHSAPDTFTLWPQGFEAMLELEAAIGQVDIEPSPVELVKLRCSQLNGCAYCIDLHHTKATQLGVDDAILTELSAWAASSRFDAAQRSALALADALTNPAAGDPGLAIADARSHFEHTQIAQLAYIIATINAWNRIARVHIDNRQ